MLQQPMIGVVIIVAVLILAAFLIPSFIKAFLRDVPAGTIRMVTWWGGSMKIYRGPGKSFELPILTNGTSISSKAINVDLDITDQTADVDRSGVPNPIKVRVLASAIVSVGDSDELIKTAANRYFAKSDDEQMATLTDLLSSSGRRAVNLLTHDQLFSAKSGAGERAPLLADREAQVSLPAVVSMEEDDDPLAIIIRKACSRELTDLGLVFNSLNIKVVQSEVAEARRRQSAAEATANADIVAANQNRRAKEAQLEAERSISDKQRELEQTRLANAVFIAEAEAKRQDALAGQKESELRATQIAQAHADSEAVKIAADAKAKSEAIRVATAARAEAEAIQVAAEAKAKAEATRISTVARAEAEAIQVAAEAKAKAEAMRITMVAAAQAEGIKKVTDAIREGGEHYLRYRQIELLPEIVPSIAQALAQAKLVTINSSGENRDAASSTTDSIASVVRTVLAAQIVSRSGLADPGPQPAMNNDGDRLETPVSKGGRS
jgi:flotillin